jgi:hypothetical protein
VHGHGHRRPPSPDVLDEEVVEDVEDEDPPTRAHVDVHNAEQFWAGEPPARLDLRHLH